MTESKYTYERVGSTYDGSPVYLVTRDGKRLGVIERVRASTDTTYSRTRIRRPGKGRNEFRPACWYNRDNEWDVSVSFGRPFLTRDEAAAWMDDFNGRHSPMPAEIIDRLIARVGDQ